MSGDNTINYLDYYNSKQIKLNEIENEKIVHNLQTLNYIQGAVATKDKLIQQIEDNTQKQNEIIFNILFFIAFLGLSVLIVLFMKKYSKPLLIIIWLYYILYYMYKYNILYLKDVINPQKIEDTIKEGADDLYDNLNKYWGKTCQETNDNSDDILVEGESIPYEEYSIPITNGLMYQDGTAPNQMIDPLPPRASNYKIIHSDYSKLVDNSQNRMREDNTDVLVGSKTNTLNL